MESNKLAAALKASDNELVVSILETKIRDDAASEAEKLLCGVLLLMPPLADYQSAKEIFALAMRGPRIFEAAVWDAYRFSVLLPDDDRSFEPILRSLTNSAIAAHMLSSVEDMSGNRSAALRENRRSCSLRIFPFNGIDALKLDREMPRSDRAALWHSICDLMVSCTAESDSSVSTIEAALQRRWENLVVGTRVTSMAWGEIKRTIDVAAS